MTTYYKYRIRCITDDKYEYWVLASTENTPTTCPTDTSHTIDSAQTSIVDTIDANVVTIKEEGVPTNGIFGVKTIVINATKNSITTVNTSWPYPISALNINFISTSTHTGDVVELTVAEDTVIGTITANVLPAVAWIAQNYTIGQTVTYTHPTFGDRVYTCIVDTISNEIPTNTTYWRHGLEISVQQTVMDNCYVGYCFKLFDGVNNNNVGHVIFKDNVNNKIYVEKNLTNTFLASSPTYIQQTIYYLENYHLCEPWEHDIGQSKIGGSYVPADTLITIHYDNKSTDTDKTFIGRVEYLY